MASTTIKTNFTHDRMSLIAKLASGASLKFSVSRSGEKLEVAFSNDRTELKTQTAKIAEWLKFRTGETNAQRFERLKSLVNGCLSGAQVISRLG